MTPEMLGAWAEVIKNALLAVALITVTVGGMRAWYVFGWVHRDAVKDRDEWKALALEHLLPLAKRSVAATERVAREVAK